MISNLIKLSSYQDIKLSSYKVIMLSGHKYKFTLNEYINNQYLHCE